MRRICLSLLLVSTLIASSIGIFGQATTHKKKKTTHPKPTPTSTATAGLTDTISSTTGVFGNEQCPPEGDGGDRDLSRLKNRDVAPAQYELMGLSDILNNDPAEAENMGKHPRSQWTSEALAEVKSWEDKGVSVQGYLFNFKHEGVESCNCHDQTHKDYHLWLVPTPTSTRDEGMVVEVSPRLLDAHPNWVSSLADIKSNHTIVRISGWLTWDEEHPEQVGNTRGTLWEIHPIHKIEVLEGSTWKSVDGN